MEGTGVETFVVEIILNGVTKRARFKLKPTVTIDSVEAKMRSTFNVANGALSSNIRDVDIVDELAAGEVYYFIEFTPPLIQGAAGTDGSAGATAASALEGATGDGGLTGATGAGGSAASTPGDKNAMFIVTALTRGQKSKKYPDGDIMYCDPIGSAFALSEDIVFTAYHNVTADGNPALVEIGLLKEWREDDILLDDIIVAKYTAGSGKEDEDWAVYTRDWKGRHFQHYLTVCPENGLPVKNEHIGIHDFPIGLFTSGTARVIEQQSVKSKVSTYESFMASNSSKPISIRKRVVKRKPPKKRKLADFRVVQVVGGRIKGSCGAAYVASNEKVFAFHVESVDDGECVSVANSFSSERSHASFSRGLVLCTIPSFMKWYKHAIQP